MSHAREVLSAARALIADQEHWVQGSYAIENTGNEVYPNESNAYAFCAMGALIKASGSYMDDAGDICATIILEVCTADCRRAARELFGCNIAALNDGEMHDDPAEAHQDVLVMFDKAIANAS